MKKIFAVSFVIIAFFSFLTFFRYTPYDAVSCATGTSGGSGGGSNSSSRKTHASYALKIIPDAGMKKKNRMLSEQINNCYLLLASLKQYVKDNTAEPDIMQIYLIVEENSVIVSDFNEKETVVIALQLKKTEAILQRIQIFLETYDAGLADAAGSRNLIKDIEALTSLYRTIQWRLYI